MKCVFWTIQNQCLDLEVWLVLTAMKVRNMNMLLNYQSLNVWTVQFGHKVCENDYDWYETKFWETGEIMHTGTKKNHLV